MFMYNFRCGKAEMPTVKAMPTFALASRSWFLRMPASVSSSSQNLQSTSTDAHRSTKDSKP